MSKRVLLYVQHLLGVGHVKRAAAICQGMIEAGLDVTVAFGGFPVPNVNFHHASVHQLPPARSADAKFSALVDEHGDVVTETWWNERERALLQLYQDVQPDLILVEHFPFGRRKFRRELVPVFERAKSRKECKIVGSVRDILIEPSNAEKTDKMIALAHEWFDTILVHADPNVIKLEDTFPAAVKIRDRLSYTGYIVEEPATNKPPSAVGHDEVIVSAGGGAVGEALFQVALDAHIAGCLPEKTWRFLVGANLDPSVAVALKDRAPETVIIEPARPDFSDLLKNAALSISQAGYNTVMDLLVAKCPAVVVPFATGGETEQTFRAEKFAAAGLLTHLSEHTLTAGTLGDAANHTFARARSQPSPDINLNGRITTGVIIAKMLH